MDFFRRRKLAAANAALDRGVSLAAAGHLEESLCMLDGIVQQHLRAPDSALRTCVATALYSKAVSLQRLERDRECHQALRELAVQFGQDSAPAVQSLVAQGLFFLACELREQGQADGAIEQYHGIVRRFGNQSAEQLRACVADSLINVSLIFREQGRYEAALEVCEALLVRLDNSRTQPPALLRRINTLSVMTELLTDLQRLEAALDCSIQALVNLGNYLGPDHAARRVGLLNARGNLLLRCGRFCEAASYYDAAFEAAEPTVGLYSAGALSTESVALRKMRAFGAQKTAARGMLWGATRDGGSPQGRTTQRRS